MDYILQKENAIRNAIEYIWNVWKERGNIVHGKDSKIGKIANLLSGTIVVQLFSYVMLSTK